ncbi:hypothetical protein BC827DRAFT_1155686 [Russula dissimulans]|nr:hypothetical protein BC827DRAFT_1155686 [Russula dissimulans]
MYKTTNSSTPNARPSPENFQAIAPSIKVSAKPKPESTSKIKHQSESANPKLGDKPKPDTANSEPRAKLANDKPSIRPKQPNPKPKPGTAKPSAKVQPGTAELKPNAANVGTSAAKAPGIADSTDKLAPAQLDMIHQNVIESIEENGASKC